jgi:hypothetical protein
MTPTLPEPSEERSTKLIREGQWMAEVDVTLIYTGHDWSPYLSADDALRLDAVRTHLRTGNLAEATKLARVYELRTVAAE